MSPEYDSKLLLTQAPTITEATITSSSDNINLLQQHKILNSNQEYRCQLLMSKWSKINGPYWNDDLSLLPYELTPEQRKVATEELKSIPEYFYSTTKLPIITPNNVDQFMQLINCNNMKLFSLCSGSSRLLLTMCSTPTHQLVLFPVDLRYGWNLGNTKHQRLLKMIDNQYKPQITTVEPRCKYWSQAGNARDPRETERLRGEELPQHRFIT